MTVHIVTGKLGSGKSKISVQKILDYLERGALVATNLDIFPENFTNVYNKTNRIIRIPDKPLIEDLHSLGSGNDTPDETKNSLIVLDECASWLNTRSFQDKDRLKVIDWFIHSRKLGWDLILIVQNMNMLDKQIREALCEYHITCKRLDRVRLPFLAYFGLKLPQVHIGIIKYGFGNDAMPAGRWVTMSKSLHKYYDTKQIFKSREFDQSFSGVYSYLTPWHLVGRYLPPKKPVTELLKLYFTWCMVMICSFLSVTSPEEWADKYGLLRRR